MALSASAETINISFTEEQVTFDNGFEDGDYYWDFVGYNANYTVALSYYGEEKLVGTYDVGDELDSYHSKIVDKQTGHTFEFESGTITISKGEGDKLHLHCEAEAMYYDYAAEQLTRNNYVIDMYYTPEETAVETSTVAAKAVKTMQNGQLLIERDGRTFTATGVELK